MPISMEAQQAFVSARQYKTRQVHLFKLYHTRPFTTIKLYGIFVQMDVDYNILIYTAMAVAAIASLSSLLMAAILAVME